MCIRDRTSPVHTLSISPGPAVRQPLLFPLDGAGRLGADVVSDAVDVGYLVDDATGYVAQERRGKIRPIGGHAVGAGDGTQNNRERVGTRVPHDTHAAPVSYTHLRAHETGRNLVCRLLLEK